MEKCGQQGVDLEAKSWASIHEIIRQMLLIATTNDLDMKKLAISLQGILEATELGCTAAIVTPNQQLTTTDTISPPFFNNTY
jgi:hypothetical protein